MADKMIRIRRASHEDRPRPALLAIAGDSAAGKSTVARGIVDALGADRCVLLSTDDYHRYDRYERAHQAFSALHPDGHHLDILSQHLQLLATGQPILKPVYDHGTGKLIRPQLVEPAEFVVVEGLLPLHSKLARACFDVTVYLDPPEEIRRRWKVTRDTTSRGYTEEQVLSELIEREADSAAFIKPQRAHADIVARFAPIDARDDAAGTPLSASLLLRTTIQQSDLSEVFQPGLSRTMHMRLARDNDGRPVDCMHVHGYASPEDSATVEKTSWLSLARDGSIPESLGRIGADERSTPLAVTQMLLLHHLVASSR
jgi:phosphoribulokinase